jgi:hypothetical protein
MSDLIKCTCCGKSKSIDDFYKCSSRKSGIQSQCKTCISSKRVRRYKGGNKKTASTTYESYCKATLNSIRARAKSKGIPFDLDFDWIASRFNGECDVTRIKLHWRKKVDIDTPSIDQIQPSGGYTKANCRVVCHWYNTAKNKFSDSDVIDMCQAVCVHQLGERW